MSKSTKALIWADMTIISESKELIFIILVQL